MRIVQQKISGVILSGAMFFAIAIVVTGVITSLATAATLPTSGDAEARFAELSQEYSRALGEYLQAVDSADRAAFRATRDRLFAIFKEGRQVLLQLENQAPNALARCQEYSGNLFDALTSIREEARAAMSQGLERAADEFYNRAISEAFLEAGKEAKAISAMREELSNAALAKLGEEARARVAANLADDVPGAPSGWVEINDDGTVRDLTWDEINDFLDTPKGQKFTEDFERDVAEAARLKKEWEKSSAGREAQALKEAEALGKREAAARARRFLTSEPGTRANVAKSCPSGRCSPSGMLNLEEIQNLAYQDKVGELTVKARQEVAAEAEYARVVADLDEKVAGDFAKMSKNDQQMRRLLREMAGQRKPTAGLGKGAIAAAAVIELVAKSAELGILITNLDTAQLAFAQEMEFTTNWLRSANTLRERIFKLLGQSCQATDFAAILTLAGQYNDLIDRAEGTTLKAMMWGGIVAQLTTGKVGLEQLDPTGIVSLFKILFNQTGELKEAPSVEVYGPLIAYADLTALLDKLALLKAAMANALQKKGEVCTTACAAGTEGACRDLGSRDVTASRDGLATLSYSGSGVESWGNINFPASGLSPAPYNNSFTSNASCPALSQEKLFCSASDVVTRGMCEQGFTVALNKEMELAAPRADFGGAGGYTWPGLKKAVDPGYVGSSVRIQRVTERIDGQDVVGYDVAPYVEVKANTWTPGPSPVVLILSALQARSGLTLTDPYYLNQTCGNSVGCDSATTNNSALRVRVPFGNLGLNPNTEYRLEVRCEGSRPTDFLGYLSAFSLRATVDGQPICVSNDSSDPTPDTLSYTYIPPTSGTPGSVIEISSSVRAAYVVNPNTATPRTDGGPIERRFNPVFKFRFIPTGTVGGGGGGGGGAGDGHAGPAF